MSAPLILNITSGNLESRQASKRERPLRAQHRNGLKQTIYMIKSVKDPASDFVQVGKTLFNVNAIFLIQCDQNGFQIRCGDRVILLGKKEAEPLLKVVGWKHQEGTK